MSPKVSRVVGACLLMTIASGCGGVAGDPRPELDVPALRITGTQHPDLLCGGENWLSPNGDRILSASPTAGGGAGAPPSADRGAEICTVGLADSSYRVVDRDLLAPDPFTARLSPDGKLAVLTDDFRQRDHEPDVWVLHALTGRLDNLTNDGVDGEIPLEPPRDASLDVLPSWSPDGRTIRFARQRQDDEQTIDLMSINAAGGEAEKLRSINGNVRELAALAWSPSGAVAWTMAPFQLGDGTVRVGDATGEDEAVVAGPRDDQDMSALSFSPDGRYLLIDSIAPYLLNGPDLPSPGLARVMPMGGGDAIPVATDVDVAFPTWAPNGHALAFLSGGDSLQVVAEPGGPARELQRGNDYTAANRVCLNWGADKILLRTGGKSTLLTVS